MIGNGQISMETQMKLKNTKYNFSLVDVLSQTSKMLNLYVVLYHSDCVDKKVLKKHKQTIFVKSQDQHMKHLVRI